MTHWGAVAPKRNYMQCRGKDRGFWWGNLRIRDYLGDPGVIGWIILRWIFRK